MSGSSLELVQGTVDVLILRTLAWQSMHGYAMSRFIRERTGGAITVEGAALYQALHRLERRRQIRSWWGLSDTNRRAKFYELTALGKRHLRTETDALREYVGALMTMLESH